LIGPTLISGSITSYNRSQRDLRQGGKKDPPKVFDGENQMSLRECLVQFVTAREMLKPFGVRDTGDYAEILVAKALDGTRNISGVERGYDVVTPGYGRVEVRSRTLPGDGRNETRIRVPDEKWGQFSWLAGVIFEPALAVYAAYLLPHDAAKALATCGRYPRFSLGDALAHAQCVNVTAQFREAERLL
jgi:hypothetical protein